MGEHVQDPGDHVAGGRGWTGVVLRHRRLVALLWLVVAVVGGVTAPTTVDRLSYDFALPGQPAYETNAEILARFGGGGTVAPLLLVVEGRDARTTAEELAPRVERGLRGVRTVTAATPGAEALAGDGTATVLVVPRAVPGPDPNAAALPALEALAERSSTDGTRVTATGFDVLAESGGGSDRGVLAEVLLGGLGALVVLALVFGSLLAGLPLLVAAVSILGTFLALLGLTAVTDVSFVVQYLVALIGLGVAIDYSLLVVTRWREERDRLVAEHPADLRLANEEAVRRAMATAGRAVVFSGVTVAVSLAALVIVPVPFLRSIGLGGLLIPLLSVLAATTLVPALLAGVGPRLLWPRRKPAPTRSRLWTAVARGVLRRRWLVVVATSVVLLALAAPVLGLRLGSPQLSGLANASPTSRAATAALEAGVPPGALRPVEVLLTGDEVDRAPAVAAQLRAVDGVAAVVAPTGSGWTGTAGAGTARLLEVWLADDPASDAGRAALDRVRTAGDELGVAVGGGPTEDADFVTAVYADAVWVVLGVVVVTFLLLARALRSVWLPVKALVLNAVSIAAAYGITVLVWQQGWGSDLLFGQEASGVVTTWVPVAAFAFLFGLSMDYEVFLLSRMREAYDEHGDTDRAVVDGVGFTGRLVTSAALILFLAFVALSTVPSVEVKILATALALGILLDAVVVRGLLAPALVGVLGRANWTLPRWLGALVRVRP